MTFAEARARIGGSGKVFGNTGHFAETVSYFAAMGGPSRSVVGSVAFDQQEKREDFGESDLERIWIQVEKDTASARGGIDRPAIGDRLLRAGDPADRAWTFQGEIRNDTGHGWELLFARRNLRRLGP